MKVHAGHGRIVCANCKAVVLQCRCIEASQVIGTVPTCPQCPKPETTSPKEST